MLLLRNMIQPYAWGPIDGLVPLLGVEPTGRSQAELWVGTHARGPSTVDEGPDEGRTLAEVVAADPFRYLGDDLAAAGDAELPYLLKVLAIGKALSVQAHPSAEQARAGFDREEAAGIPIDAPERNYRDPNPKPEALVALVPTWVLCGFREPVVAAELIADLHVPALDPLVGALREGGPTVLADALRWLLHLPDDERSMVAGEVEAAAAEAVGDRDDRADPRSWIVRLAAEQPGDPTCVMPLLLELVLLAPGESVHLPAGNLHAYLDGAGVEIMRASDNVLRGGLTSKHLDVDELLAVLDLVPGMPARPTITRPGPGLTAYDCGEASFSLVRVDPTGGAVSIEPTGPSLLLAVGGDVDVAGSDGGLSIGHGDAAFVAPGEGPLVVTGDATLWWATTGDALPA
ncbi:MAG: mannose-6-phosphate isomerase [Acidimicrobiales bacterium]|nr:mannose-6-phosphate isomerase [Acidimicrobiales bacterium]